MALDYQRVKLGVDIEGSSINTQILNGTVDPSAGGGLAADVGSLYLRDTTGVDGGELWLKFGDDDIDWALAASETGGSSAEDGFIRTFIGKSGAGAETPTYSSTNVVSSATSLETAIGALDAEIGVDITPLTRTVAQLVNTESIKANIDDLDTSIGADASLTAVSRTAGPVSTSNDIYTNLDALDAAIGADTVPTARTVGPLVAANDANSNLDALDAAIGTDAQLTAVTRTVGPVTTSQSVNQNIDDLDAVVGADADMASTTTISTASNIYANLSALDAAVATVQTGLLWLEAVDAITSDDVSAKSGLGALTDDDGSVYTPVAGDRVWSTFDNLIYTVVDPGAWTVAHTLVTGDVAFGTFDLTDTISNEGGAAYTYNGAASVKIADFDFETADSINLTGSYTAANGTVAPADSVETAIEKLAANQIDLTTLSGAAQGAVSLGTFTGDVIADSETIKGALQDVEDQLGTDAQLTPVSRTAGPVSTAQTISENIDDLDTAIGADTVPTTRTVGPLVASNDVNSNLEALDAAIGTDADIASTNFISTANSVDANLSALDAALDVIGEATATPSAATATTADSVLVDQADAVKWLVVVKDGTNKEAFEVYAMHDGLEIDLGDASDADATQVDHTIYSILKIGAAGVGGLVVDVDLNGATTAQVMRLRITTTAASDVRITRLEVQ